MPNLLSKAQSKSLFQQMGERITVNKVAEPEEKC